MSTSINHLEQQLDDLRRESRRSRRRLKLVAGGLLAAIFAFNVAPVAASHLTVSSSDIVNGEVRGVDLHNGAVNSAKIYDGSVKTVDVGNGAITPAKLSFKPVRGVQIVSVNDTANPGSGDYYSSRFLTVSCPSGKKAIGGGYYLSTSAATVTVHKNGPTSDKTGWDVWVYNGREYAVNFTGYAVCAAY